MITNTAAHIIFEPHDAVELELLVGQELLKTLGRSNLILNE
jgi:hypothetical protein